ncbi:putative MUTL-like protein 1 [Dioszegia hungarica]|uniref:MUTL-like protein 1 n=1 Tax=Dioszegia hungarica TaxID=4972 RepID=A0AA38HA78_9TREE|nr:putative MUTL-like protein 1 [Dioszegia hungarica]KAI9637283.1 putative MUTL-like protein 1 [Dioszegia hungarica]
MDVDEPAEPAAFEPKGPRPILKLHQDVVNRIAASEIVLRPAAAIKELLENSLDAGSTSIKLSIKEGGLKLIQITDNGHGINRADLPLLCERYATSKLREFKDLSSMRTYGFRGEALASISYCSHVEVVTKTREDGCGWKAHYSDGALVPAKAGAGAEPRPAAANDGTIISAEDLFYNVPMRKRSFKSASEEYNKILDVVTKYAIHNPHCAWVCKKAGSNMPDISTPVDSTARANISLLYTPSLANELLEVPLTTLKPEMLDAKCRGWVSNANSSWARKGGWMLFINNRLVESPKIKKAIDSMYTAYLAKGSNPWVYLSLEMDPAKIDVNVSPSKAEVHFLNEDEMIQAVVSAVHDVLKGANTSRSFTVQTLLPGASEPGAGASGGSARSKSRRKAAPNYKVRTDMAVRTLDGMLAPQHPGQVGEKGTGESEGEDGHGRKGKRRAMGERPEDALELEETDREDEREEGGGAYGVVLAGERGKASGGGSGEIQESMCEFTSITELRRTARKRGSTVEMTEIMSKHAFVGVVDRDLSLCLIQNGTKLYLVNHASLADEHFYQLALRQFGTMHRLRLDPAPSLRDLLWLAVDDEEGVRACGLKVDDVVNRLYDTLMDKREMIDEYFSLRLTEAGAVDSLPMVLRGYTPNMDRLPDFLMRLGVEIDWEDEKACFQGILKELAYFYSPRPVEKDPPDVGVVDAEEEEAGEGEEETTREAEHALWQIQHVLFPSFRRYTAWPAMGKEVVQVANLPDLFRIFERC